MGKFPKLYILFLSHVLAIPSWAEPASDPKPDIKIISDQMDCDQNRKICIATGHAVAEKLNEATVKILKADQITAHFQKQGETGPMKVARLEAQGNVFFIMGDVIVQGKRGDYQIETEMAEIFDEVKITKGQNQLDGSYGKINMKTGSYTVNKQGGERVQALIFTNETPKEDTKDASEE